MYKVCSQFEASNGNHQPEGKIQQLLRLLEWRIIGEFNDCAVKAVKIKGEFIWHHHEVEDELFLVIKGTLRMKFRDHEAIVRAGEFVIVPKGVEHCPAADEEVHIVLIEPKFTLNTGNIVNERTVAQLERI